MPHDCLIPRAITPLANIGALAAILISLPALAAPPAPWRPPSSSRSTHVTQASQTAAAVPGVPRFFNYVSPSGTADNAGEPSLGCNWTTEQVFNNSAGPIPNGGTVNYFGGFLSYMAKVTFNDCQSPAQATWDKKPLLTANTARVYGDPILFTDHTTGRTFVSQLEGLTPAGATTDITDNDGASFTPGVPSSLPSCVDHQTIGGGPFHAPLVGTLYPDAIYYASQCIASASCAPSLDGGQTFPPGLATPMFTAADCDGLHGHVKVAPNDGTVYVPDKACASLGVPLLNGGEAAVVVSENNGAPSSWSIRTVPGATTKGEWDASVGVANDGTIYLGYQLATGRPGIAVSHDKGVTWTHIVDLGALTGIENCAFPAVVAGDGGLTTGRAAFAFYGSTTAGASEQPTFPGVWYLYIATTFDGGATWTTQNVTPGDPIQRGGICGSGACRNMLDFFDATIDKEGRVLVGWDDGCVGGCVGGPPNSFSAKATITRQAGGKRMFAAFDPIEPRMPEAPGLVGDIAGSAVHLTWGTPDNGGSDITLYKLYRKVNGGAFTLITTTTENSYVDTVNPSDVNLYRVTAVNAQGEGPYCTDFNPGVVGPTACKLPGLMAINDVNANGSDNDAAPNVAPDSTTNIKRLFVAEPYAGPGVNQLTFTLEVAPNGTVPPSSQWYIIWNRKTIAADGSDRRFVGMKTDATGAESFVYGDWGPPLPIGGVPPANANTPTPLGNADFGSFDPATGVITIRLADSNADASPLGPGDALAALNVRTFFARVDAGQKSQNNASDITDNGSYTLVGNASCFCTVDQPPVAEVTATPTSGFAPLTVTFDASGSFDPDAGDAVASYTFTFADGTPPVTQSNPMIMHTYTQASGPSGYFATVTVGDQKCGLASLNVASQNIEVMPGATATTVTTVSADAGPGGVTVKWQTADAQIHLVNVYRAAGTTAWQPMGQITPDGEGMMVFHDADVSDGARYGYRLGVMESGQEAFMGETWVQMPRTQFRIVAIGNPSHQRADFSLGLDHDGLVGVRVFSADGRHVADLVGAWMPAGTHHVSWDGRDVTGRMAPAGVYVVQVKAGDRTAVTRVQLMQ